MRITDLLKESSISLNKSVKNKIDAIDTLIDLVDTTGVLLNKSEYKTAILAREKEGTTGIGENIAIPHAKTSAVSKPALASMVIKDGVDFDSLDGLPAKLFFMIAVPKSGNNLHLDVLSRLSVLLMDEIFKNKLINATSKENFIKLIDDMETEKFDDKKKDTKIESFYKILAVTACPTGIAHTFMAAESLENAAKKQGTTIKVETNGSGGIKNGLTKQEIQEADCIIIAADKKVEMNRFNGKKLIQTKVANGIHKADELITRALNENVPIYSDSDISDDNQDEKESPIRKIYKHLMNGVSHMLPFVIGGGILIALAFLFDDYSIDPSNFGKNTYFASILKTIGDTAFGFMLPILAGYIAMSIGDRPALAVGFVGGMLANSGGSGFLGALLAGFIAGYLILALKKIFDLLPKTLEGIKPVLLYPLFGILLIGCVITFIVNPPVSYINDSLTNLLNSMGSTSKILLGIVLGGMMAFDMGGPLNKAAYVFGTASIASGQFDIMAAVMVGGMVPPLSIALCSTFFKNRFTKRERQSGLTNYIMGLSFITEGAIPFAAADPLRVIPSCIVGSATAGALSMAFNATLRAPHGGIFVFPVVGNTLGYIVALITGSIVGMIILAILKKPIKENNNI